MITLDFRFVVLVWKIRLEVHHAETFNDICKGNSLFTVEQALTCKELWNLDSGISICYSYHKDLEKIRTKLINVFYLLKQTRELCLA